MEDNIKKFIYICSNNIVIKLKIKKTGEIKELLELRRINRHGFIEKQYVLKGDEMNYRLEYELEEV